MQFPTEHKSGPLSVLHYILLWANAIKVGKEHWVSKDLGQHFARSTLLSLLEAKIRRLID